MNKKISTLLAVLLAAGYCVTAEAGVVKVTAPKGGNTYVIGAASLTTAAANTADQLMNSTSKVAFTNRGGGAAADVNASYQWIFSGSIETEASTFTLYNVEKGQYLHDNDEAAQFESNSTNYTYSSGFKIVSTSGNSKELKNTTGVASFANTGSGTALYFYAITKPIAVTPTGQNVALKFGDKYLYVSSDVNQAKVELVSEANYLACLNGFEPTRVQWKVGAAGKYQSAFATTATYLTVNGNNFQLVSADPDATWEEATGEAETTYGQVATTAGTFSYLLLNETNGNITLDADPTSLKKMSLDQVSLPQVGEATAKKDGYDLVKTINSGEYYLLSSNALTGGSNASYVSQESNAKAATLVAYTSIDDNAFWKVSYSKGYYSFVNKKGITLKVGGATTFKPNATYNNGFRLTTDDASNNCLNIASGAITLAAANTGASASNPQILGLYSLGSVAYEASELMAEYNTYFNLQIKDGDKLTDQLQSNPFYAKDLVPMKIDGSAPNYTLKEATGNEESFLLRTTSGNYIVLDLDDKWSIAGIDEHVTAGGYKFATLTGKNMLAYLNKTGDVTLNERRLGFTFQIKHSAVDDSAIQTIEVVDNTIDRDNGFMKDADGNSIVYYMASFNSDKKTYLTVNTEKKNLVYAALHKQTVVQGTDAKNNPLLHRYVNISFVNKVSDDWTGKYTTEDGGTATLNGKVLGFKKKSSYYYGNNYSLVPVSADKNLASKPEGQWFVTMTEAADGTKAADIDNKKFTFVNRENPKRKLNITQMFSLGDNKYAVEYAEVDPDLAFCKNGFGRDTLLIAPVKPVIENDTVLINGYKDRKSVV